jgi:CubicO group peptidase (beta-lactamase class C family)
MTLLLAVSSADAAAPPWRAVLDRELNAIVEDREHPLASLAVLALRHGEVVYAAGFGVKSFDRPGPVTPDTLFRVASISKLPVAVGLMRLVEAHRLDLDADAGRYLGFALRNPHHPAVPITIQMLLTHTSSLRDDAGYSFPADWTLESVLREGGTHFGGGAQWAASAPGQSFQYTNLNWGVLAAIIERVTHQRFDRFMAAQVLGPLRVRGGFYPAGFGRSDIANLATLYRKQRPDEVWDRSGPWFPQGPDRTGHVPPTMEGLARYRPGTNGTLFSPQGGLRVSARGLGTLMQALLRGKLIKPASLKLMIDDHGNARGFGVERFAGLPGGAGSLVEDPDFRAVGVLGSAYGLRAAFAVDPASGDGLVSIIGGVGCDPDAYPGTYSGLSRWEERILTALHRRAILGQRD